MDSNTDDLKQALSSPEELIAEIAKGRMVVLVDDENRENEGDLVIAGEMADADAVNFMAKHGRGLVCLSLTAERVNQLGLSMMALENKAPLKTAFTVSIEAREGVTTGISAGDRARTVAVAIDPKKGPLDIVSPGHVFPLVARDGGVLVRAGHTEAAVDLSRLAGMNPSGVICEIMNDDGTMARLPDLVKFAQLHGLKLGTIADLIAYRLRTFSKCRMGPRMAYDIDAKSGTIDFIYSKRDAVQGNRPFFSNKCLQVRRRFEVEPHTISLRPRVKDTRLPVYMARYNVPAKLVANTQCPLKVDFCSDFPSGQGRARHSLGRGLNRKPAAAMPTLVPA